MKKVILFSTSFIFALFLLIGCGSKNNQTKIAKAYLENEITTDSKGTLKLEDFNKTNGYEQELFGMKMYVLQWEGKVSVQQEIWKGNESESGYWYWGDFSVYTAEPKFWMSSPAKYYAKGTIVNYTGECSLQKTEQGWIVKEMKLKTSSI